MSKRTKIAPALQAFVDDLHPMADDHWVEKRRLIRELRALIAVARSAESRTTIIDGVRYVIEPSQRDCTRLCVALDRLKRASRVKP